MLFPTVGGAEIGIVMKTKWNFTWKSNILISVHYQLLQPPPRSHNSLPLGVQVHLPFQSSLLHSVWEQPSCLGTRFPIQSELGVNRLFSLAAWGNLLSPCWWFFSTFLPLSNWISIISFWLSAPLHFSDAKRMRRFFLLPEQTEKGLVPAQGTVAVLGKLADACELSGLRTLSLQFMHHHSTMGTI